MHSIKDTVKQLIGKSLDAYNKKYTSPINNRIDNIVAQAGTDNTEIVDARIDSAGINHTTLNNRILAETKMTDEKLMEYSGSSLSVEDTMPGYLQNIEIKGNTIQNEDNLEDIRSVGDKVEGQELYEIPVLSCGKNLFNFEIMHGGLDTSNGSETSTDNQCRTGFLRLKPGNYRLSKNTLMWWSILAYDKNFTFNRLVYDMNDNGATFNITENDYYVRFKFDYTVEVALSDNIQLEEGTQATPYEPYVEDKLTILSPVQLEKVGDVADRIIEKDGVWGVEKNIGRELIDTKVSWIQLILDDVIMFGTSSKYKISEWFGISNYFIYESSDSNNEHFKYDINTSTIYTYIKKSKLSTQDVAGFEKWSRENGYYHKFATTQPQFIPLPHDQQIKLRAFANKTNISFGCEIEGTIKAQVPKSLGATVNTHTTQISNLNKELDRVKKLEESTVSTVKTECDFTTVEATSNGYFEDVKLEGKTLVNLFNYKSLDIINEVNIYVSARNYELTKGKEVTLVNNTDKVIIYDVSKDSSWFRSYILNANTCIKATLEESEYIKCCYGAGTRGWDVNSESDKEKIKKTCIILEGDHTQKPPSYFEGLKSVGQSATTSEDGADEIVVSSVKGDGNLFNPSTCKYNTIIFDNGVESSSSNYVVSDFIRVKSGLKYYVSGLPVVVGYDLNKNFIKILKNTNVDEYITIPTNCSYIRIRNYNHLNTIDLQKEVVNSTYLVKGSTPKQYTPHQSDKKRLLYYNNETQAWEKPILREWDSIEKHANGKYYYHQRSGEVVLNGSEFWELIPASNSQDVIGFNGGGLTTSSNPLAVICDKFPTIKAYGESANFENIFLPINTRMQVRILKSKLTTQDVTGFKQWLQTNNVTVVYKLAQEKVYECTNIDLITYANETSYVVECGAIVPKTTLKVHNNISNVVSLLQKKVSLLESNMTKYMITQNRMQLASTYSADSVTFKVDYALCSEEVEYNEDLYNLILNNILVGKDNYDYNKMFNIILDYASWNQISWEQFDILVGVMDSQHNPPIEEEIPNEIL